MSHRTQVVLTDELYGVLREESARTGASIGELVRQAVAGRYARRRVDRAEGLRILRETAGAWSDLDVDGEEYVERLRTGRRLRALRSQE